MQPIPHWPSSRQLVWQVYPLAGLHKRAILGQAQSCRAGSHPPRAVEQEGCMGGQEKLSCHMCQICQRYVVHRAWARHLNTRSFYNKLLTLHTRTLPH